ncbi:MAG: T9SS type A sorting domain-containing protein [Paludibacter sp.]
MKTKLLLFVAFCMTFSMSISAAVTGIRTATTVDVVWTADPLAASYKVLGLNNLVLATIPATTLVAPITTFSKTITGLKPVTEYTFNVSSFDAGGAETPLGMVTVTTRSAGANYEIIDTFDDSNLATWTVSNYGTFTPQEANTVLNGDSSASAGKWNWDARGKNYAGPRVPFEKITVGPSAKFQYLHVKMYRVVTGVVAVAPELGGFSFQADGRSDSTVTTVNKKIGYPTTGVTAGQFVDGVWHDYVFDLKAMSAASINYFSWYFKMNEFGGGSYILTTDYHSFIDDIYLSNSGTANNTMVKPVAVTLVAGANGTVPASGTYLKGSTITATPAVGYVIDGWSDGTNVVSTAATCTIPGAGTLTATFKVSTGINDLIEGGIINVTDHNIEVLKNVTSLQVYNTVGAMIHTQNNISAGAVISLNRGIYLVRVKSEQGVKIQKLIIR